MPKKNLFTDQEFREMILNYGVGEIKYLEEFESGEDNVNLFMDTNKGKYVLRVYNKKRKEKQIIFELSLINHLFNQCLPVPKIFLNKENHFFSNYQSYFTALFSYIEGETAQLTDINESKLKSLAETLSNIHKQLINYSPKGYKKREDMFCVVAMEEEIQRDIFPHFFDKQEFIWLKKILTKLKENLSPMKNELRELEKGARVGFVHNDFHEGNIKFMGDTVSGVFDFDDSCPGAFVSDVAIAINSFCFDEQMLNKNKMNLFLRFYETNIFLNEMEKKAIIPLMKHVNIFSIYNAVRLWYSDKKNEEYYKTKIIKSYDKLRALSI